MQIFIVSLLPCVASALDSAYVLTVHVSVVGLGAKSLLAGMWQTLRLHA